MLNDNAITTVVSYRIDGCVGCVPGLYWSYMTDFNGGGVAEQHFLSFL